MTEHFTANTESVTSWCGRCNRPTQHKVDGGRMGRCMEHKAPAETKAQVKRREEAEHEARNPRLFV
jgi:hypothetical protein